MERTRRVALAALMAAILTVSKFALDGLPNVELVSLLIILYTLEFPSLVIPSVFGYLMIYGLMNGFGIWWFPQLYIWPVLVALARGMRSMRPAWMWAVLSGLFGLSYGALYAVSYALMNGPAAGLAWWITGIPFDLAHGAGNFAVALVLFRPVRAGLRRAREAVFGADARLTRPNM